MTTTQGVPATFENYFNAFETHFPTHESRFKFAAQLAVNEPQGEVSPAGQGYIGEYLLASHWGDEGSQIRKVAYTLYALKSAINTNLTRPVVILKKGSLSDIRSSAEEGYDDRLEEDVELDYGFLAATSLLQGFAGNTTHRGKSRMGVEPPFLGFGTLLSMDKRVSISVDVLGDCKVEPVSTDTTNVPVYLGTVPLEFNQDRYHRERKTQQRVTLLGGKVSSLLTQLTLKTRDAEPLRDLAASALAA